jgi:hypothetical protein
LPRKYLQPDACINFCDFCAKMPHKNLYLPFVTYLMQPSFKNQFSERNTYIASFKGAIVIQDPINGTFLSISEAERGCEIHLQKLLDDIFDRVNPSNNLTTKSFFYWSIEIKETYL